MHGNILLQRRELCNAIIIQTVLLGAGFLAKCAICVNHAPSLARSPETRFSLKKLEFSLSRELAPEWTRLFLMQSRFKKLVEIFRIRVWGDGGMVEPRSETDVQRLLGCLKRGLARRSPPSGMCHDFSPFVYYLDSLWSFSNAKMK
jgi:hypothetical protein